MNSIHAPNGFGKSSIFEALQFSIYGKIARLERMQSSEFPENYVVNKFHQHAKATILLEFQCDASASRVVIKVTKEANGPRVVESPSGHPNPEEFLEALQEDYVLVDYTHFSDFVDSDALDRGRALASLIGLSKYSQLRKLLASAKNTQNINNDFSLLTLQSETNILNENVAQLQGQLKDICENVSGLASDTEWDASTYISAITESLQSYSPFADLLKDATLLELDFEHAYQLVDEKEHSSTVKMLGNHQERLAQIEKHAITSEDFEEVAGIVELARKRDLAVKDVGSSAIHHLLNEALLTVDSPEYGLDPSICPVCDSDLSIPLDVSLRKKLEIYAEAASLNEALSTQIRGASALHKAIELEKNSLLAASLLKRASHVVLGEARLSAVSTEVLTDFQADLIVLEKERLSTAVNLTEEIDNLSKKLPDSLVEMIKAISGAREFRIRLLELEKMESRLSQKMQRLEIRKRWRDFISSLSDEYAVAEASLVTSRLASIQSEAQTLFTSIVLGGPGIKPTLQRTGASEHVHLGLDEFHGLNGMGARPLLSESYRNALAASVYFASALTQQGIPRFIVLDDVTSSFDAGRQMLLMETIRTLVRYGSTTSIAHGLQVIVLSHDAHLEKYFDKLDSTDQWSHCRLHGLPPTGFVLPTNFNSEHLKTKALQHLNAGESEIGERFVRQYMEYKLTQVIRKVNIKVDFDYAMKPDNRTLSSHLTAISDAVKVHIMLGTCVLTPQQQSDLSVQHVTSLMSNYVSHYETGAGTPFHPHVLIAVIQSIDKLVDCFCYDKGNGNKVFYRRLDAK